MDKKNSAASLAECGLVDLRTAAPGLRFDIVYATERNFFGRAVYPAAAAWLHRDALPPLLRAMQKLEQTGCGLLVYDAYRPWSVTDLFWRESPPEIRPYLADPATGSGHNRGTTLDITLTDLRGTVLEMCSGFDEFSERASPHYPGGSAAARKNRDLLIRIMTESGFEVDQREWWHFSLHGWESYPVLDLPPV